MKKLLVFVAAGAFFAGIQTAENIKTLRLLMVAILVSATIGSMAQESERKTEFLSKKLGLYVFPAENQTKEQQEKDEYESYKWAVEQSGVDPLDLPQIEVEKVETGLDGGAVRGAAGGAAAGAAIGAIAGDAGKGAAIGATVGGMRGVGGSAARQNNAQKQAEANAIAEEQELMDNFLRAFSVSLEGRGYKVSN